MAGNESARSGGAWAAWRRLLCGCALLLAVLLPGMALAADPAKLFATTEKGFARLIIDFPSRLDLPAYSIHSDNGVLSITFSSPVSFSLPDVSAALPDYVTIARVDPDNMGIRFGLRAPLTVNHIEAGEQLFIDLMPASWQGLPPSLPPEVIASLASRARQAAMRAEQQRRAAEARLVQPVASVHLGLNPTFMRAEFIWSAGTEGRFDLKGTTATLSFDWPVPIDMHVLQAGLPKEVESVDGTSDATGSHVTFKVAAGVVPRFYRISDRDFIVDIDTASRVPANPDPLAAATGKALLAATAAGPGAGGPLAWVGRQLGAFGQKSSGPITPSVTTIGGTVRISFPFDDDTPAAVFRRGNTVWMFFDTLRGINQPAFGKDLASLASNFTVIPDSDTQVVRLDLSSSRLATLGSEGKAWVLSIGDTLLAPTAPLLLGRRFDAAGHGEVTANLGRPGRVHQFLDPIVGDTLDVVTAYPPARGIVRPLDYVDFQALRSTQGLIVRPESDGLGVRLDGALAVIGAPGGLTLSSADVAQLSADGADAPRDGFIDLNRDHFDNPVALGQRIDQLTAAAAAAQGGDKDDARLDLARLYLANDLGFEAIGVLGVMRQDEKRQDLGRDAALMLGAADTAAHRARDALKVLGDAAFADDVDAALWRSMAEGEAGNYDLARQDAIAAENLAGNYPIWVRTRFQLSAVRAALEADDDASAERFLHDIAFAELTPEQVSQYQLLAGRLAESEGRNDEALDNYGQVIAADFRPSRAEAVYRTVRLLDVTGRIDTPRAIDTLAAEALLWRGDALESAMDQLLAKLYFQSGQYRLGFETTKEAVAVFPPGPAMSALSNKAQAEFEDLFLNGRADTLDPVAALALFYDYRDLTPPGSDGDTMIRNLAARLVKIGLLPQAASLLNYQVNNRLHGAARAEVAADLALIQLAGRKPQDALSTLTGTEIPDLPPSLSRRRRLLEARALIDTGRTDLALDVLTGVTGRDADELRVDADWRGKNYEAAGSLVEQMYGPGAEDASGPGLGAGGRTDILRAAVAYALANDQMALSRLRSKFADGMAGGPEWPMFDYVTSAVQPVSSPDFVKVAKSISSLDTLDSFLASYRKVYGSTGALAPATAASLDGGGVPAPPPAG